MQHLSELNPLKGTFTNLTHEVCLQVMESTTGDVKTTTTTKSSINTTKIVKEKYIYIYILEELCEAQGVSEISCLLYENLNETQTY